MRKNRLILAGAVLAAIVAIPMLAKAARSSAGPEKDSFVALKKRRECIRAASGLRMQELESDWKIHQDARSEAMRAYDEAVRAANDIYRPCLAVKDRTECGQARNASRKQAGQELSATRASARQAWRAARKKAAAEFKASRTVCVKR